MFIYLDESGDLGFDFAKQKTTQKFVIAVLVCHCDDARKEFKKAVRRTIKNKLNNKKSKNRRVAELKGSTTTQQIKEYFFRQVQNKEWSIYTLALNKVRVEAPLRTKGSKKKLYNFLSRLLLEKLPLATASRNVELIVDRCKNNEEVKDFNQYVINQLEALLPLKTALNISHLNSVESAGLQAVDIFCWGIFRKYEMGDTKWYNVFRDRVSFETEYLR